MKLDGTAEDRVIACVRDYPRVKELLQNGESPFEESDRKFCDDIERALEQIAVNDKGWMLDNILQKKACGGTGKEKTRRKKVKQRFIVYVGVNMGIVSMKDIAI